MAAIDWRFDSSVRGVVRPTVEISLVLGGDLDTVLSGLGVVKRNIKHMRLAN